MTRRWPFLSASVVLLVATLFAPPARALDEPERLRLVGERTFADGLYPIARRVLERLVADYPKDDRIGDALFLLGRARFALGDTESALEAFRRAQAATPPPASLEAKFWEAETLFRLRRFAEAHAAYDVVVKNDAAAPHAPDAAYGLAWSDLALRRPERAAGHLQDADGADAADAGGALRRGLGRGPARAAERPGDGVAPPPKGVSRPPARHARRARPGQRRIQAQRVEGGRRAGQRRDAEQGGWHARRGTPAGRPVRTQARPLPRGREGVRRRRRREGRRGRGALPGARRPRARARAAQRPAWRPRGVPVGREQHPGRDAARLGARPRPGRQEPARPAAGGPEQERWQAVRRRGVGAIVLGALLAALPARAATLLPLVPPPPDLTALIPFAEAPLDKPPIGVVDVALPEGPTDLPSFPPATVVAPWGDKPTAAVAHPGKLACVGAFFGVASMALECGRERFAKAEYEDAAKALESYALGRHEGAVAAWETLRSRGAPVVLARAVGFWLGESLGRVGQYDRAATELERFVTGGPHPLLDAGRLRLGWWSLAARRAKQSADAFRAYLTPSSPSAAPRTGTERDWAEAGLALALLNSDFDAARDAARGLESRRSPLREPLFLRFARTLVERKKGAEAQVLIQELLAANLTPAVRAWVLLLSGEASRAQGDLDDARTQYDLARRADPAP